MHILLYGLWLVMLITLVITFALTHQRYVQGYMQAHQPDLGKADRHKTLDPWGGRRRAGVVLDWLNERQDDPALEHLRGRTLLWQGLMVCWGLGGFIVQVVWMLS